MNENQIRLWQLIRRSLYAIIKAIEKYIEAEIKGEVLDVSEAGPK